MDYDPYGPSSSRQTQDGSGARPTVKSEAGTSSSSYDPSPSSTSNSHPPHSSSSHHHYPYPPGGSTDGGPSSTPFSDHPPPQQQVDGHGGHGHGQSQNESPAPGPLKWKRVGGKANVSSACGPCKKAHLACDVARPCKRCVNMGKQDQCEDVPHKKRGRPKVPKPSLGEPYHRSRPMPSESSNGVGKWRGPSGYDAPSYMPNGLDPSMGMGSHIPPPMTRPAGDPEAAYLPQPFTLFTTTEFRILRASPSCYPLIGYHPNEFVNLNLLDWIDPQDRHLLDVERGRLLSVPYVEQPLRSTDVTQTAITQRSELELLSPAEGMREPYPNKNVRVLHADGRYSAFNVRLHLGGGLGASLWQPNSLGRVYIVVSFLAIPRPHNPPPPPDLASGRRPSQLGPPTPVTPAPPGGIAGPGLPGFSSIAAGVTSPQPRYDQPPLPSAQGGYYPPSGPSSSSMARPPPPGNPPPVYQPYGRSAPGPSTGYIPRRSTSPSGAGGSGAYRTPQTGTYPVGTQDYAMQMGYYPPPSASSSAHAGPSSAGLGGDYRRPSGEEDWRGQHGNGNGNGGASGSGAGGWKGGNGSGSGSGAGDGSRRPWEQ
ncbi:hypothetical protein IAT38_006613 [Cryptococcus sp. DSM 104549]